jgi:hypothetical protein
LDLTFAYTARGHAEANVRHATLTLCQCPSFSLDMTDTSFVCICCVGQPSTARIQDAVRRLNKKNADARILLALFGAESVAPTIGPVGAKVCSGSFGATLEAIIQATTKQHGVTTADAKDIIAT